MIQRQRPTHLFGCLLASPLVEINKTQAAFVPLQAPKCLPRTNAVYITSHPSDSTPYIYPTPRPFPLPTQLTPRSLPLAKAKAVVAPLLVVVAMAVQAQFLSHAFPHDLHAFRALEGATAGGSLFLDDHGGCAPAVVGVGNTVLSDLPLSELTCNDNYAFVPRKRARLAAEEPAGFVALPQAAAMHGLVLPGNAQSRAVGCGAASTSGRMANAACLSQGILSQLYHQGVEVDALIQLESERMRAGLEEARRRHARAVVATVERAAAGRLRAMEAELERARCRNTELEESLRQMSAEGQAWLGVAKSHEAVAAGLRSTLDQLLQPPCAITNAGQGDVEDAQSCCFETPAGDNADDAASNAVVTSCKACGVGEACVLLLPCRHLCLCRACEASADACPVCAATKNASLHILLS